MAEDDNFFKKIGNFFSPATWWEAAAGAITGKSDDLEKIENPSFQDRLGSFASNNQTLQGIATGYEAATNAPIVGAPLKFALDLPMRTIDATFAGAQRYDFEGDQDFGDFFSGWRRSWDNWGTAEHVSAGALLSGTLTDSAATTRADLFTQQGVDNIDALSKKTWYGNIAGGVFDLTAGFVGPETAIVPIVRAAKATKALDTAAKVEATADVFNDARAAGTADALRVDAGKSFVKGLTGVPQSGETYAARMLRQAREAAGHSGNMVDAMNYFGPRMTHATEGAKRVMAETAVYANKLDADAGAHLVVNTQLALMGSERAAAEVIKTAPLVMAKITNATEAPQDLAIMAQGMEKLYKAHVEGNFEGIPQIMDEIFETPRKQAEFAALKSEWERAAEDAARAREIRLRIKVSKPQTRIMGNDGKFIDNFDTARLKESRANADNAVRSLSEQLREAKLEAKGNARWADAGNKAGKKGDIQSTADFNQGKGAADQRVASLEKDLAEAKADRDLLMSTPLNDPDAFGKWRDSMTASKMSAKNAQRKADFLQAMERSAAKSLRADRAQMRRISPQLNSTNAWLADLMAAKDGVETSVGIAGDTMLQRMKTRFRDRVGQTYLFDTGDYTPRVFFHRLGNDTVSQIGTAYGRRAVNTNDLYKGSQELPMFLKKSGVFDGNEIRQWTEDFLNATPKSRPEVVARARDLMMERMLLDAGFDPRQIPEHVRLMSAGMSSQRSYLTGRLSKAEASGDMWVKTNELPDLNGGTAIHMFDTPFLRSHLGDTVPFADPADVKRYINLKKKAHIRELGDRALGAVDEFNYWWKVAQLARPGLFFRNMIDTGIRAQMLMGTMPLVAEAANGSRNKIRNLGVRVGDWSKRSTEGTALERAGARMGPESLAKHYIGDKGTRIDVGSGETHQFNLYDLVDGHASAASIAAIRGAATKGASMGEGIMGSGLPLYDRLIKDQAKWDKFKATAPDEQWVHAYKDHAEALLASPTARKMMELETRRVDPTFNDPHLVDDLFRDPKVRDEFAKAAADEGFTREQWVEQIIWEMDNMFPEAGMAEAVMSGRLQGRAADDWVREHFPLEARFDLPGKESRLGEGASARARFHEWAQGTLNSFFDAIIDQPDFWLIRHPVMVRGYSSAVKREAAALTRARQAKHGDDWHLSERDIATIDRRARAHAIGQVKEYMYDNTYSNGVGWLHRVAPFFNPWYDAMRAYSKLIADNPQRLRNLFGMWNAPTAVSPWLPEPLVIDENGNPLKPGQEPEEGGRFIAMNGLIGRKSSMGEGVKLRQESFNTLLMGEVPWLPGWGPTVTVPLAKAINSNEDVALWLSDKNQNPAVRTLMQSLWPDGQVPASDVGSLWDSIKPATWKKIGDWLGMSRTYWTNVQYGINAAYIRSLQTGEPFDVRKAEAEAKAQAGSAGLWSVVSQGIFGISAKSDVEGEFYAARMSEYMSLDPAVLKSEGYPSAQAKFIDEFPEAESLVWSFTRNETGIQATIKAQSKAGDLRPMIEDVPDMGWFIVGDDNVGGDFSQTAYNQQRQNLYGITQKGRKVLQPGEVMENTLVGVGWSQFNAIATTIDTLAQQYGFSREVVSAVRRLYAQQIGQGNPQWFADYNERANRRDVFFLNADKIAQDPRMAGRQDIGMYVEYRKARQEVLDMFGLKALSGTSEKSLMAKNVLYQLGQQMATRNLGFQQMWERMLLSEVEPKEGEVIGTGN